MDLNLIGKSVLVTGSSKGIGRAIAEVFHSEGCRVALNGRNTSILLAATGHLAGAMGFAGDMTQPHDAQRVISNVLNAFGSLDILVCNVGSGRSVPPGHETSEEWQRVFALNFLSTTNTVEAAKSALFASQGSIVCISSICGLEVIAGAPVTYSAAKAALHAYVRGISRPLGKQGVRINAVAPGNILFEGSVWHQRLLENPSAVEQMLQRDVSLGSLGKPGDVARLVAYLASPLSAFATGQIWTLDGGQTHS